MSIIYLSLGTQFKPTLTKYINGIIVVEDTDHTPRLIGAKVALEDFTDSFGKDTYHSLQMESGLYILIKRADSINP